MSAGIELQKGCFVSDQSDLVLARNGSLAWTKVFGPQDQTDDIKALSLFYIELDLGSSPAIHLDECEAVLYLQQGPCTVSIAGQTFDAKEGCGLHVRKHEHFSFQNDNTSKSKWLVSLCPGRSELQFESNGTSDFNHDYPERMVNANSSESHASADRFYKLLVGPTTGSNEVTQFLGKIPPSKAPEHFHLYEESICILSGHGRMWAGDQHTDIKTGSMIFLPRKQAHCLECLDPEGMQLMGVFYPAGSPAINYKTD